MRSEKKTRVALVQINNSFSGQNYLPYSVGILQGYAEKYAKHPERFEFGLPVYKRESISSILKQVAGADFAFFSAYVWNINISIEVARRIKQEHPETVVVFGGPQVPDRVEGFLKKYPFIDVVSHGEGEPTFLDILETDLAAARERDWAHVQSVSFIADDKVVTTPKRERIKDIGMIPSPFLAGTFDPLMAANPGERWIMMWETNRGCPFSCAYCDWGSSTQSRVFKFDMERITKEIDWMASKKIEYVFCADANFGMLERDLEIVQYVAEKKRSTGYPHALSVQNTKNATERAYKVQKLLSDSGLNKGVTLALQSTDPTALKNVKRSNISTASYQELQRRFTRDRVDTYSDIILGLPGETYESFVQGVCECIENGQHNRIQFGNLSILPNAAMGDPEYQKQYKLDLVESPVANIHGSIDITEDEILENQTLVVGTYSLSREDWVRTRAFAWTCSLLHFNKVLQIPFLLLHAHFGIPFREIITIFTDRNLEAFPVLCRIQKRFRDKAVDIQKGGPEYEASRKWLEIWWPIDELILIEICTEGKLDRFYDEAEKIVSLYLRDHFIEVPRDLLHDSFELNKRLIKLPQQNRDLRIELEYNVWEVYQAARVGEKLPILEGKYVYGVERSTKVWTQWEDWCREVIWWGNKKGAYLYTNMRAEPQIAGHY